MANISIAGDFLGNCRNLHGKITVVPMNLGKGGEKVEFRDLVTEPLGGSQILLSCHNAGKLGTLKPFQNVFNHLAYDERQNELSSLKHLTLFVSK